MSNPFIKATKYESKLRLAITGPSGSGKTYTALTFAEQLANGGKVALIDTEHGSASKYAGDPFEFDVVNMEPPFHPDNYVKLIQAAQNAGYEVLIIDSLSHAWEGSGGLLEIVEQIARSKYKGNSYAAWSDGTPIHNRLIDAIIRSNMHIINTMRSKEAYILVEENGKTRPEKVGMEPIQRKGMTYEHDIVLDMDTDNTALVSKTRCAAITGGIYPKPGKEFMDTVIDWLEGAPPPDYREEAANAPDLDTWAKNALNIPGVAQYLQTTKRLADWYLYLFKGYEGGSISPEQAVRVLERYVELRSEGGLNTKEAADEALAQMVSEFELEAEDE